MRHSRTAASLDQSSFSSKNGFGYSNGGGQRFNPIRRDSNQSQHNDSIEGNESRKRTTQSLLEYLHQKNRKQFLGLRRQGPPGTAPIGEVRRNLNGNDL